MNSRHAEWEAALAHADVPPECTRLYPLKPGDAGGRWIPPGDLISSGQTWLDPSLLADINADENVDAHRIFVRIEEDDDRALIGGRMRHELEHVRQYCALGCCVFNLYDVISNALKRAGKWNRHAVNAIPAERDANAAASMYLRERHRDKVEALSRSDERQLACSVVGPEPFETLPSRMVAVMMAHRRDCEALAAAYQRPLAGWLDYRCEGASDLWAALEAGARPGTLAVPLRGYRGPAPIETRTPVR